MMLRNVLLTLTAITSLLYSLQGWTCSCLWQGSFSEVHNQGDLVLTGEVIASKGNSVDLHVETLIRGQEYQTRIRIWMNTDNLCRPEVSGFPAGSRWLMSLNRINNDVPGGFNPNTPNVSHGRLGDYSLSKCGGYWLPLHEDRVSGNLVSGTRWDMDPKMTPVLLELVVGYVQGRLDKATLQEAAQESAIPRELMLDTKSFLREQR